MHELWNGKDSLKVTGKVGPRTLGAIRRFQESVVEFKTQSIKVDPGNLSMNALNDLSPIWTCAKAPDVRLNGRVFNP